MYGRAIRLKFSRSEIFEVGNHLDYKIINENIQKFNNSKGNLSVFIVSRSNMSLVRGLICRYVVWIGGGVIVSKKIKKSLWGFISMRYIRDINLIYLLSEGTEEYIYSPPSHKEIIQQSISTLNKALKCRALFLKENEENSNTLFMDRLFKRIVDGSLLLNPKDSAVVDHTKG